MRAKIEIDERQAEELYLEGMTDPEAAQTMGISDWNYGKWRRDKGYPDNHRLFNWQGNLSVAELKRIPKKYLRVEGME